MGIVFSKKKTGIIGLAGHVGCGHTHSINGLIQDDSAGFAVLLKLCQEASGVSLKISSVEREGNAIITRLDSGGRGRVEVRRGLTVHEEVFLSKLVGREVITVQTLVLETFGRMYGQGVLEAPSALEASLANAALDSLYRNCPEQFLFGTEDFAQNMGNLLGCVLEIGGVPVSVLISVNATAGGLGPNEDLEGNSPQHIKKELLAKLGMLDLPTIIVESMILSAYSAKVQEKSFMIRADLEDDNPFVAAAIVKAAEQEGFAFCRIEDGMNKRVQGKLKQRTAEVAEKIIGLGTQLKESESAEEKVQIVGELALVVSQECGGISFMSNSLHDELGGGGMIPHTAAVINILLPKDYPHLIPFLSMADIENYVRLLKTSVRILAAEDLENAKEHITKFA